MAPTVRMPRRERRAQLLAIATEVFRARGYQGTSMDDIAAAAGVTKPVLYQHFTSKETLYKEVIDVLGASLLEVARSLRDVPGPPQARVEEGLRRFTEMVEVENTLRLFTGRGDVSEEIEQQVAGLLDALALEVAGVLIAYRDVTPAHARVIGRMMIAIAQSTARLAHEAGDEASREDLLRTTTALVVDGLTGFALREDAPAPAE
ncbi:TetR/AcrR family transcriptional regulator [Brachybacterium sp. SGAir0954]|uniref:TetR/AcrR family transcriptional regulator n=1 Tax=Brachybacterium sp. SGAir0954 TaxID=2571029 RepID=UPI0010CCD432|nr:TetR/AcrR family transcriptional regulator [Brachybacterium sp. SGAir0954]QCR54425.1 TetR/AcrR family transcriptional regulator [Brachybacterium sp. SGAir0954]